jgi:hypothetical protein
VGLPELVLASVGVERLVKVTVSGTVPFSDSI